MYLDAVFDGNTCEGIKLGDRVNYVIRATVNTYTDRGRRFR